MKMNWAAFFIALFMFLFLLEISIQMFINYGRDKQDGFIKMKIKAYKERKAQKEKSNGVSM